MRKLASNEMQCERGERIPTRRVWRGLSLEDLAAKARSAESMLAADQRGCLLLGL